jgi:glycerophosphoryl diester phosphodiesterase
VFSDGVIMPDEALNKLGAKIIPAFRINDNADADSLASFLKGRSQRDAYAVSTNLAVLKRAYSNWKYIRGVADYSSYTSFDPEELRYNALANSARVLILPESASRDAITQIQDSYSCVWLAISEGKTASVAATNKGPYGLITPDRALTEYCYQNYYGNNTLIRRTNVVGHRGIPSMAPENTILGTQTAYSNGANMVENDIYLTTDGVVVVMHDTTLDRTTNGSGTVTDLSYAQIKKYKVDYYSGVAAQPIPTLEDYFKSIKGNPKQRLVIEMKHPPEASLANAMSALIKKYDIMDQVVIISFIQNNLIYTSRNLPGAPVGWLNWLKLDENNPVYATYETLAAQLGFTTDPTGLTFEPSTSDAAVCQAVKAMNVGEVSNVIEGTDGYYVAMRMETNYKSLTEELFNIRLQERMDSAKVDNSRKIYTRLDAGEFYGKLNTQRTILLAAQAQTPAN